MRCPRRSWERYGGPPPDDDDGDDDDDDDDDDDEEDDDENDDDDHTSTLPCRNSFPPTDVTIMTRDSVRFCWAGPGAAERKPAGASRRSASCPLSPRAADRRPRPGRCPSLRVPAFARFLS
eukprot:2696382-Rhodomonas_salina.1